MFVKFCLDLVLLHFSPGGERRQGVLELVDLFLVVFPFPFRCALILKLLCLLDLDITSPYFPPEGFMYLVPVANVLASTVGLEFGMIRWWEISARKIRVALVMAWILNITGFFGHYVDYSSLSIRKGMCVDQMRGFWSLHSVV